MTFSVNLRNLYSYLTVQQRSDLLDEIAAAVHLLQYFGSAETLDDDTAYCAVFISRKIKTDVDALKIELKSRFFDAGGFLGK